MSRKKITSKDYSEVATGVRLSSHEKLCAERMNNILKSIEEMQSNLSAQIEEQKAPALTLKTKEW